MSQKATTASSQKATTKKQPQQLSPKSKKKKCVKNTFELVQFKKMIGKGLVVPYKGANQPIDEKIKDKILSGLVKTIGMSGFVSSGIIYIFQGLDRLHSIHSISYAEIKKANLEIDICIAQYSKMTPQDLI